MSHLCRALLIAGTVLALWFCVAAGVTAAASKPAPTATPYPTYTPYPSPTVAAPTTTPTATPTPVLQSGPGGGPGSVCKQGEFAFPVPLPFITGTFCLPASSFLGFLVRQVAALFVSAVGVVLSPFRDVLTTEPRIDQWLDGADLFHYAYGLGWGIAGAFWTLAGLHWLSNASRRDFEPLMSIKEAILGGLFMGAMPFYVPILFGTGSWLVSQIEGHVGTLQMSALSRLISDMLGAVNSPGEALVDLFVVLLMVIFGFLVGLVRLIAVYGLAWLYIVGPMAMATWIYPPTRAIATRWFAAFCSIILWAPGWAISLQVIAVVYLGLPESDALWKNPVLTALSGLSALVLLFVTPRLVDMLIGTGIAAVSGAYALTEGLIGGVVGGATAAAGRRARP